jgi:hypothetical protein
MLSSITPLGERGRGNRWALTVSAYMVGSTAGGCLLGAFLGSLGVVLRIIARPSSSFVWCSVAAICLLAGIGEVLPRLRITTTRRQVNEDWLDSYRGWVYGLGFGFQLGMGIVTIVTSVAVFAMMAVAVLSGSLAGGIVIGVTFGIVRALPIAAFSRVTDPSALQRRHRLLHAWAPRARVVAAGVLSAVAVAALVTATTR